MTKKVFVTDKNMATFVCPECKALKTANVEKYAPLKKEIKLKIKCACGISYSATLERRRQYRKETDLPGEYFLSLSDGKVRKGNLTVKDISREGLKIKVNVVPKVEVGTKFMVEFCLDDKQKTLIKRDVIIKWISGHFIGAEFCSIDPSGPIDKAIGFYLF
jgi:hypothetical protein